MPNQANAARVDPVKLSSATYSYSTPLARRSLAVGQAVRHVLAHARLGEPVTLRLSPADADVILSALDLAYRFGSSDREHDA